MAQASASRIRQRTIYCATSATFQDGDTCVTLVMANDCMRVSSVVSANNSVSTADLLESDEGPAPIILAFRIAAGDLPDNIGDLPTADQKDAARSVICEWVGEALKRHADTPVTGHVSNRGTLQ